MVCAILITQIVHNFEIGKSVRYLLKIFRRDVGMWYLKALGLEKSSGRTDGVHILPRTADRSVRV